MKLLMSGTKSNFNAIISNIRYVQKAKDLIARKREKSKNSIPMFTTELWTLLWIATTLKQIATSFDLIVNEQIIFV